MNNNINNETALTTDLAAARPPRSGRSTTTSLSSSPRARGAAAAAATMMVASVLESTAEYLQSIASAASQGETTGVNENGDMEELTMDFAKKITMATSIGAISTAIATTDAVPSSNNSTTSTTTAVPVPEHPSAFVVALNTWADSITSVASAAYSSVVTAGASSSTPPSSNTATSNPLVAAVEDATTVAEIATITAAAAEKATELSDACGGLTSALTARALGIIAQAASQAIPQVNDDDNEGSNAGTTTSSQSSNVEDDDIDYDNICYPSNTSYELPTVKQVTVNQIRFLVSLQPCNYMDCDEVKELEVFGSLSGYSKTELLGMFHFIYKLTKDQTILWVHHGTDDSGKRTGLVAISSSNGVYFDKYPELPEKLAVSKATRCGRFRHYKICIHKITGHAAQDDLVTMAADYCLDLATSSITREHLSIALWHASGQSTASMPPLLVSSDSLKKLSLIPFRLKSLQFEGFLLSQDQCSVIATVSVNVDKLGFEGCKNLSACISMNHGTTNNFEPSCSLILNCDCTFSGGGESACFQGFLDSLASSTVLKGLVLGLDHVDEQIILRIVKASAENVHLKVLGMYTDDANLAEVCRIVLENKLHCRLEKLCFPKRTAGFVSDVVKVVRAIPTIQHVAGCNACQDTYDTELLPHLEINRTQSYMKNLTAEAAPETDCFKKRMVFLIEESWSRNKPHVAFHILKKQCHALFSLKEEISPDQAC